MKQIYLLIGIALVLMLCISPVVAVSNDDFEIVTGKDGKKNTYTYSNVNNPDEKYFRIHTTGTLIMHSLVTIKPAKIPDAPVMVVDTYRENPRIYLPYHSVDEWEIKYYSKFGGPIDQPDREYLKNAGTINLVKRFQGNLKYGLILDLSIDMCISAVYDPEGYYTWHIPEV